MLPGSGPLFCRPLDADVAQEREKTGALLVPGALPVQADHGGVVLQDTLLGTQDGLGKGVNGLARVQVASVLDQGREVLGGGVALEHAVGDQDEAVTWSQLERLDAVRVHQRSAEGRIDLGSEAREAPPRRSQGHG